MRRNKLTRNIRPVTFDEHPVEAGEVEEEGGDPAGAVDLVKYRKQVTSKFWERKRNIYE